MINRLYRISTGNGQIALSLTKTSSNNKPLVKNGIWLSELPYYLKSSFQHITCTTKQENEVHTQGKKPNVSLRKSGYWTF